MHLGNRLKRIRNSIGLSQAAVCKGIVSPSHYSNIESGRYEASEDILELIAARLNVPTAYLVEIHTSSPEITELLNKFQTLINENINDASIFLEENKEQLKYIPGIFQEVKFILLSCQLHLKLDDRSIAKQYYNDLLLYVQEDKATSLPSDLMFQYLYVSALIHYYERNFDKSFYFYKEALDYSSSEEEKGKLLFNMALICFNINDNQKGLQYALESKRLYLDLHKWEETVNTYVLIGILYNELKEYTKSAEQLKKGLNLAEEQQFTEQQSKLLHNLGMVYYNQSDLETALYYFTESLLLKEKYEIGNLFVSYVAIAKVHLQTITFEKFNEIYSKAASAANSDFDRLKLQALKAKQEFLLENFDQYEVLIEESINYFYENQYWFDLIDISSEFSQYLYKNRKYKKAYDYLKMELEAHQFVYRENS